MQGIFFYEEGDWPPQKLGDLKKNDIKKQWFQIQKHEKYLKSKNDIKKRLGALNQELWANFEFENSEI